MTCKAVIFAVVLLSPAFVFAQGVSVETDSAPDLESGNPGDTPPTDAASEPTSGEPDGESATDMPSEQVGEGAEEKPAVEPVVINDDDTLHMRLTKGHLLFMQSDYQGALSAYMSAKTMEPSVAETYVFIGHTLGKLNQHDDAMVTLTAVSALVENKDDAIQAKALFASAAIEETRGPSEAVKEGWMAYKNYAQTHNNVVTFESTATARLAALEKMQELDKKYQLVRERIAKNNQ